MPRKQGVPLYGGQAVIEGVMMRGRHYMAMAMRKPSGKITIYREKLSPIYSSLWVRIPFVRGLVLLWDSLALGSRALTISANAQVTKKEEKLSGASLALTMVVSLSLAIGLFFIAPAGISHLIEGFLNLSPTIGNLLEGVIRLSILIGYLVAIGRLKEIKRVFGYHGAEHKTINAFESAAKLRPEVVRKYPIEHPRCGTAFLLTVVLFSVLLFALIGPMPLLQRIALRVALIPLLASVAYEYLRFTARYFHVPLVRVLVAPNLAMQRLTTRPPDKRMLEVGIAAFNAMRRLERKAEKVAA
ncbi:MAG: DUF1385 domain-containing protein [Anaerolineales bacterium]